MKKLLLILLTVMMGLGSLSLKAQNTLTVADGSATNSYVPVYGLYVDEYLRCQTIYPAGMIDAAAVATGLNGGTISALTYYLTTPAAAEWTSANFEVRIKEVGATTLSAFISMTDATTVYSGPLDGTQSTMTINLTTPYTYQGGNLLVEVISTVTGTFKSATFAGVNADGASWQGHSSAAWSSVSGSAQNFIPKTTFTFTGGSEITCRPVQNLAVDAAQLTSNSVTLTWTDSLNSGSSYTIYDMADNTVVASGLSSTTYTISGLSPNTTYFFGVEANCSPTDASSKISVEVLTLCGAIDVLPYTDGLESVPTGSYQMPYCWNRYASPYTSTATYPYSYSGNAHGGSRSLYFYGATAASYSDTMMAIMPQIDVAVNPMSGNRVTFWAKMSTATASKNIFVGTMSNPDDPSTFVLVDSVLVSGNTYTLFSVPMTNATGSYVTFVVYKGTGTMYVDDITIELTPSCFEVSNLSVSGTSSNSVTLQWADAQNNNASYSIYIADSLVGTTTETTFTVNGLTPNTTYTFGVEANCASGDGNVMTVSATTSCAPYALPFSETFDATLSSDACWRGATGTTADEALAGTPLTLTANSQWTYSSSESNGLPAGHYRVNIYGSSCKKWMITPEIDLTQATSPLLTFDAAFTVYTGTTPASGFENNTSQAFIVLASTNNGQTWTTVSNISLASLASSTYLTQYLDLSAFAGQTVRIGFYAQSTVSGGDNNLHIDNIQISQSSGTLCLPVTNLSAGNVTENSATLSWSGSSDSYNVYVIAANDTTLVQNVTVDSLELTGLSTMTVYTYGVCAVCNGSESPMSTLTFTTACAAVTLPYTETFEANSNTANCWTVEGNGNWTLGVGDYSISTGAFEGSQNAKITHGTTGTVTKYVSPVLAGADNGLVLDFAYVLRAWSGDIDELRVYSRADADGAWQQVAAYTDEAVSWTTQTLVIPGAVYQIAFEHTDNYGYGVGIDSVVFTAMTGEFCYAVTNLTVDEVTPNSVSLSWTDDNNTGVTYTIYDMADNTVLVSGLTTTSYEVTGLTNSTSYTFAVVANCSSTSASNAVTVNAVTYCAEGGCQITIVGNDSYGDGWNGNAINVIQDSVIIGTFTLLGGSSLTETYSVCSGSPVSFSWVAGSYPSEVSFQILDGGNATAYLGSGDDMTDGSTFFTLNDPCPTCVAPVIMVGDVTETSITVSWTGTAASYDVYNGTAFVANVTTNTYTFTGLTNSTGYNIGVQAICSAEDSSVVTTVYVVTNCPDVTILPYYEGFENDLGCWSTVNGSSDGQPWTVNNCAGLSDVNPHGGAYVASSWSWNSSAMHANAWLISPRFVLPNTTDSISFSWWDITNASYPDSYSVVLSTTTKDTASFTTVLYPYTAAAGDWTLRTVDLTPYAGQSIYIAFHHQDYDENYLLVDDIALYQGAYIPPAPDTLTVIFSVNNATMGTTIPAPGTYQYISGDTVTFSPVANPGYQFTNWVIAAGTNLDTLPSNYVSVYFLANSMMSYGTVSLTALFAVDSTSTPTNPTVATVAAMPVAQTTATLNATITNPDNVNITAKGFEWKATSGGSFTQIAGTGTGNTFSADLTGLTPNTGYTFKAFITFNGTTVYGDELTFTTQPGDTPEPCEAPTGLTVTGVTDESITITWDANPNVNSWNIQYGVAGVSILNATSNTNSFTLSNLTPATTYVIQVQADCGDGNESVWTSAVTATTTVGIANRLENSVTLFPNPAREYVDIRVDGDLNVSMMEVYDVYGKLINTINVTDNMTRINISGLADGMYFVRVTTEEGMVTKTFVKR